MDPSIEKLKKMQHEMNRFEAEIFDVIGSRQVYSHVVPPPLPPPPPPPIPTLQPPMGMFMPPQLRFRSSLPMQVPNIPLMRPNFGNQLFNSNIPTPIPSLPSKTVYSAAPQINLVSAEPTLKQEPTQELDSAQLAQSISIGQISGLNENSGSDTVLLPTFTIVDPPKPVSIKVEMPSVSTQPVKKKSHKNKKQDKKDAKKYLRSAGGIIWEDKSLVDWDPHDFRMFCGDLGNEVSDEVLTRVFNRYPSFKKAKVIRNKRTQKSKGFGFVSFGDPADFSRAIKEMNGKYVGNRPIKLKRSEWANRKYEVVKKREKDRRKFLLKF